MVGGIFLYTDHPGSAKLKCPDWDARTPDSIWNIHKVEVTQADNKRPKDSAKFMTTKMNRRQYLS